jgi:hypothetical protein
VRSGKIVYGVEMIDRAKKGVFLLIAEETLGKSSFKTIVNAREKLGCELLLTKQGVLSELLHRPAVKTVAIKENNLAAAILSAVADDPQFKLYSGGNN